MTTDTATKRAAIYVRVSTTRQAEADLSIPDQIKQLREYCARRGWTVADEFTEPGASARDDDRPAFQDMISKATGLDRPYDVVVVHSLSRFSRDTMDSEFYVRKLRRSDVELVSITQELGQDAHGDLIRKIVNAFDEHQSRENAKHTHRAMLENARQGFWNGAAPPFGYATAIRERRGNKDKKVLVINEEEARLVRKIFGLYLGEDGPPMGLKAIVNHLNQQGINRRGRRFGIGSLQDLLTTSTYCGRHYFNQTDSRSKKKRPRSQWIEMAVPAIIDEETFNRTQLTLRSRSPRRTPPRVVNGPTMLAGVARCAHCGAAMIQNTGKGGLYRYYCCSRKMKQGATACPGQRIRMDELDKMVLDYLSGQLFTPERLEKLLASFLHEASQNAQARKERLRQARDSRAELDAGLNRLLALVERGLMQPDDPALAERMEQIQRQKAELDREVSRLQDSLKLGAPILTPDKLDTLSIAMRKRLADGPPQLRQAYMRLILQSVTVGANEIRLEGPPAALERLAQNGPSSSLPEVLSFAQEWRPREDSNLRPPV
jgi:site-specific DNA recombinase